MPRTRKSNFGYQDGTFTGARRGGSRGLIREADQGTLFLDEIGDNSRLHPLLEGLRLRGDGQLCRITAEPCVPSPTATIVPSVRAVALCQ
jgi:transcriptional regulator of aromatic amino acid metabolism